MSAANQPTLEEFRSEVQAFLHANASTLEDNDDDNRRLYSVSAAKEFFGALAEAGLAGIAYPVEFGGVGLGSEYAEVWQVEAKKYALPLGPVAISHGMCLPVLNDFGTDEQKAAHLGKIISAEEIWCQMFSEPGAGSDVAGLQMKAERDGDEWIINGQKVWTSGAQYCDYGLCVARTDPSLPKHAGLSMFIIDMNGPGVEIRPLRQITGNSDFNEVFLTDARIPANWLVGDLNAGWNVAIAMLMYERVALGTGGSIPGSRTDPLIDAARDTGQGDDPVVRQALADVYIREQIQRYIGIRIRSAVEAGRAPGPEGSIAKLSSAMLAIRAAGLGMALAGAGGQAWDPADGEAKSWSMGVVSAPAIGIAGGTNEIQRNIIGERVLGLPKEPDPFKGAPFAEIPMSAS
jgi:alkylation response protein AidB-like acyl-CoA dehydrogenase